MKYSVKLVIDDELNEVIYMTNLMALTEKAKAGDKGFVSEQVVTNSLANEYREKGCEFCLRAIEMNDDLTLFGDLVLTDLEAYSIMSRQNGGGALCFMPLFKVPKYYEEVDKITLGLGDGKVKTSSTVSHEKFESITLTQNNVKDLANKNAKNAIERMQVIGLPLNMTVWLDEQSLMNMIGITSELIKIYKDAWKDKLIRQGYSVGYYGGDMEECLCPSVNSNNSVLEVVECGAPLNSFKIITIGENSGTCAIRWAFLNN